MEGGAQCLLAWSKNDFQKCINMSTSDISTRTNEEFLDNCFRHVIISDRHAQSETENRSSASQPRIVHFRKKNIY